MKNKILNIFLIILITVVFTNCQNENYKNPVDECVEPNLIATKTVQEIYNLTTATAKLYPDEDIIEAVVTSSDEGGNFFKVISFMSLDGTRGFSVSIDEYNLYTKKLQPGRKVYIKLKGLYSIRQTSGPGGLNLGGPPSGNFGTPARLSALDFEKNVISTCTVLNEDTFAKPLTISQIKNDLYLNALVDIDNVQFENDGATYGNNATETFDKNENIVDGVTSVPTRTSKFSNFAGSIVPSGKGKIRGVVTKFGSTYQLILRTERDVNMTKPRVDYAIPLVGNNLVYLSTLNENFESYATSQTNFPSYVNDAFVGNRYWGVKQFPAGTGNKYIEMSSFQSGASNKTYLAIPVNFTAANNFSFKTKDGFNKGNALKVYYSTSYTPGGIINTGTFTDITSAFAISTGNTNGYASTFLNSGLYNIPVTVVGNGFIFFEYSGNTTITTTIQLDDIVIN